MHGLILDINWLAWRMPGCIVHKAANLCCDIKLQYYCWFRLDLIYPVNNPRLSFLWLKFPLFHGYLLRFQSLLAMEPFLVFAIHIFGDSKLSAVCTMTLIVGWFVFTFFFCWLNIYLLLFAFVSVLSCSILIADPCCRSFVGYIPISMFVKLAGSLVASRWKLLSSAARNIPHVACTYLLVTSNFLTELHIYIYIYYIIIIYICI